MADSVQLAATALGRAIGPFEPALRSAASAAAVLRVLGWDPPPGISDIGLTAIDIGSLLGKLDAVLDARANAGVDENGAQIDINVTLYAELVAALAKFLDDLRALATSLPGALPGNYIAKTEIDKQLLPRLTSTLVMQYAMQQVPLAFHALRFLGIFELRPFPANPAIFQVEHLRHTIRTDRISLLLSDPNALVKDVYGWGTPSFDVITLLSSFGHILSSLGAQGQIRPLPRRVEERLSGAAVPAADTDPMPQLIISIVRGLGFVPLDMGVSLYGVRPTSAGASDGGIGLFPYAKGTAQFNIPLSDSLTFEIDSSLDLVGGVVLTVRPNQAIKMQTGVTSTGAIEAAATGSVGLTLRYHQENQRTTLLSLAGVASLDLQEFYVTLGAGLVPGGTFDLFVEAGLKGLRLTVGGANADGFLQKILPGDGLSLEVDLIGGWAGSKGVYFRGSAGLEVQLPVHIELGPLAIEGATIGVRFKDGKIPVEASASMSAHLGPLAASVERLGLIAELSFPSQGGNLGPLDLALRFKPPTGVGLSLDAGPVKGGGYLFIDADRGEYAGALELSLFEVVTIKAIGIITTKMPDGSKGFSLLIIMSVEFGSGIQLGFGFTLLAVGGLLGLNRTMTLQALAEGVRSGAIESVMFPKDIIANAPKIISDLRAFFPPQEGTFLIGPMVKLGWGTPTLISVSLGIVIEIPGNIAILGIVQIALPTPDAALIKLQVNFIGAIEFDKKRIWFFAALFDSRILFLTLEGEMGLLVAFGDDANFVVSAGGFHPRFSPPPLPFPSPRRIAISILNTPVARIRVESYFAVTSNTAQFGSRSEVFFGLDEINVQGHLAFDALFQFSPFFFIVEISASFSVNVFGAGLFSVSLSGSLAGPGPWHIEGHGSISILFWDIGVDFSETWGEDRREELPPIPVLPLLKGELDKAENWRAFLPPGSTLFVSMRKMPEAEAALILHPVGVLRISQRAVPLDLKLDKVGSRKPSDVNRLYLNVTGGGLAKKGDAFEQFAPAQYQNFSDADKLSRPAFAPEHSGLDLSAAGEDLRSSNMVRRVVLYEEIIIDSNFKRFRRRFRGFFGVLFEFFLNGSAITQCQLSRAAQKKLQPFDDKIELKTETYTVAFQANNKAFSEETVSFHSEASARDYLDRQVTTDPTMADRIHVIPSFERAA
jgi:hypothetical protein